MSADIAALRKIWKDSFGDPDNVLDAFFATGFSPERCRFIRREGEIVSALYWFDCSLEGEKIAYLYALATDPAHRGKGLARQLLTETHDRLRDRGYAGALLVPGERALFRFYENIGYRTVCQIGECTARWGDVPADLTPITPQDYGKLRTQYLPMGGVVQEGETLAYLATQTGLYQGKDFLLAATVDGDTLVAQEFLGNADAIPGILRYFGIPTGRFRTAGTDRDFAMLLPLREDCPVPSYFGLALD